MARRLATIAKYINEHVRGISAYVESSWSSTDRRCEAKKFLRAVHEYQISTAASTLERQVDVSDWKAPRRSVWWRDGLARARRAGLLDANGRVTWKRLSARESFRLHTIPDGWYTGKRTRRA